MKPITLFLIAFILACGIYGIYIWIDNKGEKDKFNRQIGSFIIDLSDTKLGAYSRDSLKYKNLILTFNSDHTFRLNMNVPFIYDSSGTWTVPGAMSSDWNYIYYHRNKSIRTQFSNMLTSDSTFLLNSVTPQVDSIPVNQIYFKKLKDNSEIEAVKIQR